MSAFSIILRAISLAFGSLRFKVMLFLYMKNCLAETWFFNSLFILDTIKWRVENEDLTLILLLSLLLNYIKFDGQNFNGAECIILRALGH
jgi:hypothetical protein